VADKNYRNFWKFSYSKKYDYILEVIYLYSVTGNYILASKGLKCILPLLRGNIFNYMEKKCIFFRRTEDGNCQHKKFRFLRL
jgi:hypothetical protein